MNIIFFGTPDFAVGILDAIHQSNYNIVAVVTAADKPAGRGQKLQESAVKKYAQLHQYPILQPTNLKNTEFLEDLASYNADLFIVVAFRMLPISVWKMPKYGTFNLHASLLPQYRGAAPINWAIINGETQTGVTTFFIDEKIDTGEIILQNQITIPHNANAGDLHDLLMELGKTTVIKTIALIENGHVKTIQQPAFEPKTAYKLTKENTKIDWNTNGKAIIQLIKGLSPYPTAWCNAKNGGQNFTLKIYDATFISEKHMEQVGKAIVEDKKLKICISDGYIELLHLQMPGKKAMDTKSLLNGFTIHNDFILS